MIIRHEISLLKLSPYVYSFFFKEKPFVKKYFKIRGIYKNLNLINIFMNIVFDHFRSSLTIISIMIGLLCYKILPIILNSLFLAKKVVNNFSVIIYNTPLNSFLYISYSYKSLKRDCCAKRKISCCWRW